MKISSVIVLLACPLFASFGSRSINQPVFDEPLQKAETARTYQFNASNTLPISVDLIPFNSTDNKTSYKVMIDPGHGGENIGGFHGEHKEKDINLEAALDLKRLLEKSGIQVYLTRESDVFVSLEDRVKAAEKIKPDVFISIHCNYFSNSEVSGLETYYHKEHSKELAEEIQENILEHVNMPSRGVKRARFVVIKEVSSPSVLVELGFLTNQEDRKLLTNPKTQDKYIEGIAEGISEFLDIKPGDENL